LRKTKQITIESTNYELIEISATRRSIIALQLKHIATGAKEGLKDLDSDLDYIKMVTGVIERIEPEKGAFLLRDIIMNGVQFPILKDYDGYDEHFGEFYDHQIDLVAEIMQMNFGKTIETVKKKLQKTGIVTKIFSEVAKVAQE